MNDMKGHYLLILCLDIKCDAINEFLCIKICATIFYETNSTFSCGFVEFITYIFVLNVMEVFDFNIHCIFGGKIYCVN